jgi:hypothetical protein
MGPNGAIDLCGTWEIIRIQLRHLCMVLVLVVCKTSQKSTCFFMEYFISREDLGHA